jgi:hypothetical protein
MSDQEIYQQALALARHPDRHFLPLGKLMDKLKTQNADVFRVWLAEAGLSRRKAYYLIRIARYFDGYPDQARLERIGWSKLLLLTSLENESALEGLLHLAETETARNLSRTLRGLEDQGRTRCVLFYFTKAEYAAVEKALIAHGAGKVGKALLEKEKALLNLVAAHA